MHQSQINDRTEVLAQSLVQETRLSLTGKWLDYSLDLAGLIPGLGLTAAAAGLGLALARRDYAGLAMGLASLMPLTGTWLSMWKIIGRVKKLIKAARFAARVNGRAAGLAMAT